MQHFLSFTLLSYTIHVTRLVSVYLVVVCHYNDTSITIVFIIFSKNSYFEPICLFKKIKTPSNMKFFAILSTVIFAAIAVAGPTQANGQDKDQIEKRQVQAYPPPA